MTSTMRTRFKVFIVLTVLAVGFYSLSLMHSSSIAVAKVETGPGPEIKVTATVEVATTAKPLLSNEQLLTLKRERDLNPCGDGSEFYLKFMETESVVPKYDYLVSGWEIQPRPANKPVPVRSTFSPKRCKEAQPETKLWNDCKAHCYMRYYKQEFILPEYDMVNVDNLDTVDEWWQAMALIGWHLKSPLEYTCKNIQSFGNWAACQDEPYTVTAPCLVYSFGINNQWSFDDAMAKVGCNVHAFDPSMKVNDHKRGQRIQFYRMGISHTDTNTYQPVKDWYVHDNNPWKVQTLATIMKNLGHQNSTLDLLKIDVESYEFDILHNMIETGVLKKVRQLLLEYHVFMWRQSKTKFPSYIKDIKKLGELGFKSFFKTQHNHRFFPDLVKLQGEVLYVNTKFPGTA